MRPALDGWQLKTINAPSGIDHEQLRMNMVRLGLLPSFILFQWALLCVLMLINTPEFCPESATPPQALYMALAPVILTSHWFLAALGTG